MNLKDLTIAGTDGLTDILVENERIVGIRGVKASLSLSFPGAIVFPGLINSHDHLDFNLFPPLANRVYRNYNEWGPDIHRQNKEEIDAVLKIPQALRTQWGIYKNLLNGITTVVNHGERLVTNFSSLGARQEEGEKGEDEPVRVFQDCHCLHSVGFERNWKWKLNRPFTGAEPFVLHVGEGTDREAEQEIDRLIRWNLFKKPLIGIHGVAMREDQAGGFKALVWCPVTNFFLLGRTARVERLKNRLPILFGTDSTLTAGWNIWEHLRLARQQGQLTDKELMDTLTRNPAAVWGLTDRGELAPGRVADLVIARPKKGLSGMDAFYGVDPEDILLVLRRGRVRLFDASLRDSLSGAGFATENFFPVSIGNESKYVQGDLPGLVKKIREYDPAAALPVRIE
jgi:cytosine/adenosine deaminase-related metal-dependent hydrolase